MLLRLTLSERLKTTTPPYPLLVQNIGTFMLKACFGVRGKPRTVGDNRVGYSYRKAAAFWGIIGYLRKHRTSASL